MSFREALEDEEYFKRMDAELTGQGIVHERYLMMFPAFGMSFLCACHLAPRLPLIRGFHFTFYVVSECPSFFLYIIFFT